MDSWRVLVSSSPGTGRVHGFAIEKNWHWSRSWECRKAIADFDYGNANQPARSIDAIHHDHRPNGGWLFQADDSAAGFSDDQSQRSRIRGNPGARIGTPASL